MTSDAGTIMRELDVEHPAAKLMIMASQMQESEVGDGTNFVVILCGALLEAAEDLLRLGITVADICEGYEKALDKIKELLPALVCYEIEVSKTRNFVKFDNHKMEILGCSQYRKSEGRTKGLDHVETAGQ